MTKIKTVKGLQILDSKSRPTLEVELTLYNSNVYISSVPSGSSTGAYEALELRDNTNSYDGMSVNKVIDLINLAVSPMLHTLDVSNQIEIDQRLIDLDGTKNKSKLGANGILGVSIACIRAAAGELNIELYKHLKLSNRESKMPIPMLNVINGGMHANNIISIQELMIIPVGDSSFAVALEKSVAVFNRIKSRLNALNMSTGVGDEGGFIPNLTNRAALDLLVLCMRDIGLVPGKDMAIALDCAASSFYKNGKYVIKEEGLALDSKSWISYLKNLCDDYPIISIEDGVSENDIEGWVLFSEEFNKRIMVVGDDIFVTNASRLLEYSKMGIANAILIKPNQIGSVSETIDCINQAIDLNYDFIISHRSGETIDTFIADLAVGTAAKYVKFGAPSRGERVAKYNRLLRIEKTL